MRKKPIIPKLTPHLLDGDPPLFFDWRELRFRAVPRQRGRWAAKADGVKIVLCDLGYWGGRRFEAVCARRGFKVEGADHTPTAALNKLRRGLSRIVRQGDDAEHVLNVIDAFD